MVANPATFVVSVVVEFCAIRGRDLSLSDIDYYCWHYEEAVEWAHRIFRNYPLPMIYSYLLRLERITHDNQPRKSTGSTRHQG